MGRKDAREFVMQCLFEMDAQKEFSAPDMEKYLTRRELGEQAQYVNAVLTMASEHIQEIDAIINRHSKGWPTTRMAKTDLAIVRLAVTEMAYQPDVPPGVAINEAVNLAHLYGGDASPSFVNAILRQVKREMKACEDVEQKQ